jgi:hypothetical protein
MSDLENKLIRLRQTIVQVIGNSTIEPFVSEIPRVIIDKTISLKKI